MVKIFSFILLLAITVTTSISDLRAEAELSPIQIGFILPLSGKRASVGKDARNGVTLALEHLNNDKTKRIQAVFEDSQGDPAKGVSAYRKLKAQGIKLIVTQNSNISLPISPLVNRNGVLQLAISTTSDRFSTPDDLTFRINGPTLYEARHMIAFLHSRIKSDSAKLAVITMEDEYSLSLSKNVMKELEAKNITAVVKQNFLPEELDFRTIISGLKKKRVQNIIFLGYQTQAGYFVKQQEELGLNPYTILTSVPVNNIEFFESAGNSAEGTFNTYIKVNTDFPAAKDYANTFGEEVNFFSANGYDAIMVADRALKNCTYKLDPDCWKKELFKIKDFEGLSGKKGFDDHYGDMNDQYQVMIARNGKFTPYKEVT